MALEPDTGMPLARERRAAEERAAEVRPSGASLGSKQSVGACQCVSESLSASQSVGDSQSDNQLPPVSESGSDSQTIRCPRQCSSLRC